jgi:DNA-binding Xre family transcriptional regulator
VNDVKINAKFIKTRLVELEMSARDLATAAGIGEATMYRILNGGPFESRTLGKVAAALGCNPVDLIESEGFASPHVDAPVVSGIRA